MRSVKHLLYVEKYTIDGARQKVEERRKTGELRDVTFGALHVEVLQALEESLRDLHDLLHDEADA